MRCRLLVLVGAVWIAAGTAIAGEASGPSSSEEGGDGDIPEWAQEVYGEPPEFKTFEVSGHRFRVPTDYLTASSDQERGVFQIAPHWPTLDSPRTDKPQPRDREDFDTLQVTVMPFDDYERRQSIIQRRINEVEAARHDPDQDVEVRGALARLEGGHFWITPEPVSLGGTGQVVQIPCDPDAPADRVGRCRVSYMPFSGIEVQIKFDRVLFERWQMIVHRVHGLLSKFREQ